MPRNLHAAGLYAAYDFLEVTSHLYILDFVNKH